MKKRSILLVAGVLIALLVVLPIPGPNDEGAYNVISRMYWCGNERACIHERAHKMDQRKGWISQGKEFGEALELYAITQMASRCPSTTAMMIMEFPGLFRPAERPFWNAKAEIYAEIYEQAEGKIENIVKELRCFYD